MYVRESKACQTGKLQFRILAPSHKGLPRRPGHLVLNTREHSEQLVDVQRLRGRVYQEYAPIAATFLPDGRHCPGRLDDEGWHITMHDGESVVGCARYRIIENFNQLICSESALAQSPVTGPIFRAAFERSLAEARRRGVHYGEASAWALNPEVRCSTTAVNIALMSFALADWLGGGMGLTTASTRHHASLILRRLGGSPLAGFAPYYEPSFDCTIELLEFDIRHLEPRYAVKLEELKAELRRTPIYCPAEDGFAHEYFSDQELARQMPAYIPAQVPYSGVALNSGR
jgi:hypothetical protein